MINGRLLSFTQLFACIFLYCVLIQGWEQAEGKVTPNLKQKINDTSTADLKSRLHERKRRSPNDRRTTCGSKVNCGTTSFETAHFLNCHCDNACYEVFFDCCPDHEEYCGRQKPDKNVDKNVWKCVKLGIFNGLCKVFEASGVWMIEKCPRNWPSDGTRKKCEIPKFVNVIDSIPVVGDDTLTYRNKYCAVCHGVQNYSTWNIHALIYIIHEYTIDNEKFLVNKTDEVYLLIDYTLLKDEGGNVTLFRKLVLSGCIYGAYVPLSPDEYVIFPNLTLYHNATNSPFEFGKYLLSESFNKGNISNITQNSVLSSNWTVSVCLQFKNTCNETETKYSTSTTSYGLRILRLFAFSISAVCHILLLITYGLFQELRTVPGLNLMNLSFSMLLSQVIWLVGIEGTVCEVVSILQHYFLQVSFLAMSVISYHSCLVLTQPIVGRIANTSRGRFIKYSAFVWLSAAIFVAICVILDKTETLLVDYGTNFWLGTANAKLYLFLLPLAVILLYNIYKFIRTAVSLSRHEKDGRTFLQRKGSRIRKQNLLICTKLATLVGLPWLFAFIHVLFPEAEVCKYLFVVFVCLQGVCIAMVFLFKKKILKLYQDWWNRRVISIGTTRNIPESQTIFKLS